MVLPTGHIHNRGGYCRQQLQFSRSQHKGRQRVESGFRARPSPRKIGQVSPVQPVFHDVQHTMAEIVANNIVMLTLRIVYPTPKGLISHFKSLTVNRGYGIRTYNPTSFLKVFGGIAEHFPRGFIDIGVCPSVKVLDLVGPLPQPSVIEDG